MAADAVTTRADLVALIRDAYERYSSAIAGLPDNLVTKAGTCGTWSVRDVIAHVGWDELWMAGQIEAWRFGTMPTAATCYGIDTPPPADMDWSQDGRNAWQHERLRSLSLEDTRGMAREAHARLLAVITSLDDAQLADKLAIGELGTVGQIREPRANEPAWPLWEWLRGVTYKHYDEHTEQILAAAANGQQVGSN